VKDLPVQTQAMSYDFSGRSVSNAGDMNGDGYDDLIIGVPYASRCYVMFGTELGFMNMTEGFTIFGAQSSDLTGWSVSGAGDVNNDTFADLIIGAPYATNAAGVVSGAAYVIYGRASRSTSDIHLSIISATQGVVIYGAADSDVLGVSVSGAGLRLLSKLFKVIYLFIYLFLIYAGDVNGDGFDDVIIGALKSTEFYSGAAYVIYGNHTIQSAVHLSSLETRAGFVLTGANWAWCGYSVSGAGE
jgi:hypothetical protein